MVIVYNTVYFGIGIYDWNKREKDLKNPHTKLIQKHIACIGNFLGSFSYYTYNIFQCLYFTKAEQYLYIWNQKKFFLYIFLQKYFTSSYTRYIAYCFWAGSDKRRTVLPNTCMVKIQVLFELLFLDYELIWFQS